MLPELTGVSVTVFLRGLIVAGIIAGFLLRILAESSPVGGSRFDD